MLLWVVLLTVLNGATKKGSCGLSLVVKWSKVYYFQICTITISSNVLMGKMVIFGVEADVKVKMENKPVWVS